MDGQDPTVEEVCGCHMAERCPAPSAPAEGGVDRSARQVATGLIVALVIVIVIVVIVVIVAATHHSAGSSPSATTTSGSSDPASLLASEDGSSDIATYSAALDRWQGNCTESRVSDAGYADSVPNLEQKYKVIGGDTSRLQMMEHLAASVQVVSRRTATRWPRRI
jgi:hypothetical protein